jgi:lipopolysaccharide export LptBFGC system permease protein LptF
MTFRELRQEMEDIRASGISDVSPILTRINKKVALSFASLAFVLMGIPLAVKTHRSEKSIGFGISLALLIIYGLLLAAGNMFTIRKVLPPWLAMWFGNIIFMTVGVFYFYKTARR